MTETAQSSSDFADEGRKRFTEAGDPTGIAQQLLGAAGWLTSPLSALIPHGAEKGLPEEIQPVARAGMDLGDIFMPGPGEILAPGQAVLMGIMSKNKNMMRRLPEFTQDEARGMGDQQLHREHGGWFRDKDLQPKYEVPDTNMQFTNRFGQVMEDARSGGSIIPATKFWDAFYHPELRATAEDLLGDIKVYPSGLGWGSGQRGSFNPMDREITLELPPMVSGPVDWEGILKTAGHETQHAIAYSHPGWAGGANPAWVDMQRYMHYPEYGDAKHNYAEAGAKFSREAYAARQAWFDKQLADKNPESKRIWQAFKDLSEAQSYKNTPDELLALAELFKQQPEPVQNQLRAAFMNKLQAGENLFKIPYAQDSAFDLYAAKLDEVNARTVEHRMGMSPEDLMAEAFWETRDRAVYPHDRIIPFYDFNQPRNKAQQARPMGPKGQR